MTGTHTATCRATALGSPPGHAGGRSGPRAARRRLYVRNLTRALTRADRVLTNSAYTAATTQRFAAANGVAGLAEPSGRPAGEPDRHQPGPRERSRARAAGGDRRRRSPPVFFVGGADERRRLDLLVDAFNHLRSRVTTSRSCSPVTRSPRSTRWRCSRHATPSGRRPTATTSTCSATSAAPSANWLFEHAAALVFPSEMEGFGLPVVEALAAGCPVVAVDNSAMHEVAGPGCRLVGETWRELASGIAEVLELDPTARAAEVDAGRRWAREFTRDRFGTVLAAAVEGLRPGRIGGAAAPGDPGQPGFATK